MAMYETLGRFLEPGATLKVRCDNCQRRTTWTRDEALRLFGAEATPYDIGRRLRCKGCGKSGRASVWI